MIHTVQNNKDVMTFTTLIKVDGRLVRLSYSRLVQYLKPKHISNPEFKEIFLFRKEAYTNEKVDDKEMNHAMYNWIRESNYSRVTGIWHELQWDEIKVDNKGHYLIVSDSKKSFPIAIPPSTTYRYDCITVDGYYHYGCNENDFKGFDKIEIILNAKK